LVRLVAKRFPAEVKARSQGRSTSDQTEFSADASRAAPAVPVSTLSNVASQSFPKVARRSNRRRWLLAGVALALAPLAAFAVSLSVFRSNGTADPAGARVASAPDRDAGLASASAPALAAAPPSPLDAQLSAPPTISPNGAVPPGSASAVDRDVHAAAPA